MTPLERHSYFRFNLQPSDPVQEPFELENSLPAIYGERVPGPVAPLVLKRGLAPFLTCK
jgi:hypothetical protein